MIPLLETPAALALGLAIPAILLLWMLQPRRPRLRVPSLLLWPASPTERHAARPWQRIRRHPLLWLQLATAILLALAAARPFLPASPAGRHLIVLLDASGSMRATDWRPDRFSRAKDAILGLARGLGPGQSLTLIRLDAQPQVRVTGATSAAPVEAILASETASFGAADLPAALALAAGLAAGPAEWILVSDGGLAIPPDAHLPPGTQFRFIPIGEPAGNVAVAGLAVRSGEDRAIQVEVRNTGDRPASGRVHLYAEGQLIGAQAFTAAPRQSAFLTWSRLAPGPRWYAADLAEVDSALNQLAHDDRTWAAVAADSQTNVLLVSERNSFLERLLGIYGTLRPFRATPADWPALATQGPAYPLTVLDRLWSDPAPKGNVLLVGPPIGATFHPSNIRLQADQPLLQHVDWTDVQIATARRLPLDASWETVIDSDGGPLLAIRERDGRREAAFAFSLSDTDLPLRPAFPVLLANLFDWLLPRPDAAPRAVVPGEALVIDPAPLAQQVWVELPGGSRLDLAPPWPPRPFYPPAPGLFRVIQASEGGRSEALVVAEGYDPQEADLTPRTIELRASAGSPPVAARGALAFWPWLAAAILLLSTAEWWIDART